MLGLAERPPHVVLITTLRDLSSHSPNPSSVSPLLLVAQEHADKVLDILGRSLAPSIYGHEYIKKALILQAVGGEWWW